MTKSTKFATLSVLAMAMTLVTAGTTQGQGIGFSFGKHKRGKHVGVGINLPLGGGHHHGGHHHGGHHHPPAHIHGHGCQRWIPGYHQTVMQRVFVPGATRQVWVAPIYRTDYDACGRPVQVVAQAGYYQTFQDPGYHQDVPQQTFVPGHWQYVCGL